MSDSVFARNCCMTRMLPGEAELVSEKTGLLGGGGAKSVSAFSGPTDRILRYIRTRKLSYRYSIKTTSLRYSSENHCIFGQPVRGFAKNLFSENPRLLWKWVGWSMSHSEFLF